MHDLVVARYREDLDWIEAVPPEFRVHIYNKGPDRIPDAIGARAASVTQLPNTGRESDSFLTYLIDRNHLDSEFTVFTQGDPFEHSPDFVALLSLAAQWKPLQPLAWTWRESRNIPPEALLRSRCQDRIAGLRIRAERFSLSTWNPVEFIDGGAVRIGQAYRALHSLEEGSNLAAHFFALCGLWKLANLAARHLLGRFSYGAIFAVHTARLEALPVEQLYIMRHFAGMEYCYGYMIERIWLHLFGERFVMPVSELT